MTKMFGEMTGADVMDMYHKFDEELKSSHNDTRTSMVMVPKSTFVAIVSELKDCLNRKFFFELGRSLQLEENQESVLKTIPPKYQADYQDGIQQRESIKQLMADQCNSCTKRFISVKGLRGKVFIGTKGVKSESSS